MFRRIAPALFVFALVVGLTPLGVARADHTDPRTPLGSTEGPAPAAPITRGIGTWEFIKNMGIPPTGTGLTGGGTDLKVFTRNRELYASGGTLGQADTPGHIGQRIIRLTTAGEVAPAWVFDHGSAHCATENPGGTTGLQHDIAVANLKGVQLLIDTTDATGRCHDGAGGGLELIAGTGRNRATWIPREIHLTRHAGTSHTVTVDAKRPWIVYNSSSDFANRPWIDVLDIRTCILPLPMSVEDKRATCRPVVYRIPFQPEWTQMRDVHDGNLAPAAGSAACHDITARPGRIYCAALNATLILDVRNLTDPVTRDVRGTPLACTVVDGEATGAKVTDCTATQDPAAVAEGWEFLGTYNHPGRDCVPHVPPAPPTTTCNSNNFVRSDEGVSVAHEADPTEDGNHMLVTDERGGGVVPPGSSCIPGVDNPYGNGGAHALDISDPSNIDYALTPAGDHAVYISDAVVPAETFCDVHVIELIPGEQRFLAAYYTQGTKIVDYTIDQNGAWTFTEVASYTPRGVDANTWAVDQFRIVDNGDGTKTYFMLANDISRGLDVFSWTGPAGPPLGTVTPAKGGSIHTEDAALLGLGAVLLPAAALYGRRRRARSAA